MNSTTHANDGCTAWSPGVRPGVPYEFRELETIFRPECVTTGIDEVGEFASLTGLPHEELVSFRHSRLALHEVIVRVTAEIAIAEGDQEEELGQNFRRATMILLNDYIMPSMDSFEQIYGNLCRTVNTEVSNILAETMFHLPPAPQPRPFPLSQLFRRHAPIVRTESMLEREQRIITDYKTAGLAAEDPLQSAIYRSLYRILGAIITTNGSIGSDQHLLTRLVTRNVCNHYGSQIIGNEIESLIDTAIDREGYSRVRAQAAPILLSLKGASAAGKSSLRPMLKQLMRDQGVAPDSSMTISPDIWRKLLLDYDSLGPARKYAGYLTSREVTVVDEKLDRYIRDKADKKKSIPHIMVDRFRFDSFSSDRVKRVLDGTYAKYVNAMYMYFIITPPEDTVERGWQRALERGRYKAVEDFLGHCVEAYSGMPNVLFKWLSHRKLNYHYYFLDNMVPKGTFPRVAAYGDRNTMTIFDPLVLINVARYKKINIYAKSPIDVYPSGSARHAGNNVEFLKKCINQVPMVNFVSRSSGAIYLQFACGKGKIVDAATYKIVNTDKDIAEVIGHLIPANEHFATIIYNRGLR